MSADRAYVRALRELCDQRGWLLMIDEVQSGIGAPANGSASSGRTSNRRDDGRQGTRSGVPIGASRPPDERLASSVQATTARPSVWTARLPRGMETLRILKEEKPARQPATRARAFAMALRASCRSTRHRGNPRQGLMIGVELDRPCGELVTMALEARLLINVSRTA